MSRPTSQVPGPYEDTTCQMVAAYGTKDHPHLETMRNFRDAVLQKTRLGRNVTELYYRVSPPVARLLVKNRSLARIFRNAIGKPLHLLAGFFIKN